MAKPGKHDARIFAVETRFEKLAKRPGGISRDTAIERAQSGIEEVKPEFDSWLDTELQELAKLIKTAELGKADPAWIESANFHSRQLRDSATTLQFELLSFIANSLCDVLDVIQVDNNYNMESITCHMDALMLARQKSYRRLRPEQVPELTKGLRRIVERVTILPPGAEEERS
jgi:hypothetical protein